jgi:hypothetical protein
MKVGKTIKMARKRNKAAIPPYKKEPAKIPEGMKKVIAALIAKGGQFKRAKAARKRYQGDAECARRRTQMEKGWYKADRFVDGQWVKV